MNDTNNKDFLNILARTIYGEARGEYHSKDNLDSLIAIGNVVMNRVAEQTWFGKSISEVCLKPYQFSCWNKNDPNRDVILHVQNNNEVFKVCIDVAEKVINGTYDDVTNGANSYYSTDLKVPPKWADESKFTVQIGKHKFYKL
jgi:spore germination cell wall hydrolase CwlJ-like protein